MSNDSLGDRMKGYEVAARTELPRRLPIIIRVDGKAFHTYTRGCKRPFDSRLSETMLHVAKQLCSQIQGAQLAYTQSDEISVLVHGYKKFDSGSWFDNQVQKMVSVAAGIASSEFTINSWKIWMGGVAAPVGLECLKPAVFDARAFVVPESDVCNYFLWRQQDATRNSLQMLARSLYSHKELDGKNGSELQEMCFQKLKNWNDLETRWKRGACVHRVFSQGPIGWKRGACVHRVFSQGPIGWKRGACVHRVFSQGPIGGWYPGDPEPAVRSSWEVDYEIPVFSQDRNYVDRHLKLEEG